MIRPKCYVCKKEQSDYGAILWGPPTNAIKIMEDILSGLFNKKKIQEVISKETWWAKDSLASRRLAKRILWLLKVYSNEKEFCEKRHICKSCYKKILSVMEQGGKK
jgi:hypothetical protein